MTGLTFIVSTTTGVVVAWETLTSPVTSKANQLKISDKTVALKNSVQKKDENKTAQVIASKITNKTI